MRTILLLSFALAPLIVSGQTPPPPAPAPAAPRPAAPAAAAARASMVITATDPKGATMPGIHVSLTGPVTREGETDNNGTVRFTGLRAGTYRLRFSSEDVISFEREVVLAANRSADVDVTLNHAEPKPAPPPPPPPPPTPTVAPAPVGPAGQPRTLSIVDLVEREMIGRNQPRRDTLVACSGNTRTMLVQLNQEQTQRLYERAETLLYVVAGEGTVKLNGRDSALGPGGFVSVPRNVPYSIARRGSKPLILMSIHAGEPCEQGQ
jgi:mannose-6-phosphate isomerase-like protein (cupin superfamily)